MVRNNLEERLARLENEMARVKGILRLSQPEDWIGFLGEDEVAERVFERAMEYREADRRRIRA